jgi:hypothetical protein
MKTTTKKRLTKSNMEELVWDLWSSYSESDVDGVCGVLPCWGPYSDENGEDIDQDKARETLKKSRAMTRLMKNRCIRRFYPNRAKIPAPI